MSDNFIPRGPSNNFYPIVTLVEVFNSPKLQQKITPLEVPFALVR